MGFLPARPGYHTASAASAQTYLNSNSVSTFTASANITNLYLLWPPMHVESITSGSSPSVDFSEKALSKPPRGISSLESDGSME